MTATAYFDVHQHRGMYAGALYCVERGRDLVERIRSLSNELVSEIEVQRARNLLADIEQQATSARQAWRVSSARLTRVLRLNPQAVVVPLEHDHLQVTLIDPARPLPDLHVIALTNRPELASYQALVEAAVARIRREKGRMYLPTVLINGFQTPDEMIQAGIFGLGTNDKLNQWVGRDDVSLQLMWQLEGMGIGNLARIKEQRGEQSKAIIDFFKIQDMVAADVTRAQADLQSAAARVEQADRSLRTGIATFNGSFEGLQHTTRFGDVLVLIQPAAGSRLRAPAHEAVLRRVLHDGRRLQPGAIRVVPRAWLPRPRDHLRAAAGQHRTGGHDAARLLAPGGQWTASGNPLTRQARLRFFVGNISARCAIMGSPGGAGWYKELTAEAIFVVGGSVPRAPGCSNRPIAGHRPARPRPLGQSLHPIRRE